MMLFFSFFLAWVRVRYAKLRGFRVLATPTEQAIRLGTCQGCKWLDDSECRVCGCLVFAKVMIAPERCPKKFWPRIWDKPVTIKR